MIVSHRNQFIFISNGKAASTSIETALAEYQEEERLNIEIPYLFSRGHIPPRILAAIVPTKVWNTYFKFCFVRNPWDWVVSQFMYNGVHRRWRVPWSTNLDSARRPASEPPVRPREDAVRITTDDVRYLSRFLRHFRAEPDENTLYQSSYCTSRSGDMMLDFVGRYEELQADFDQVCDAVGIATQQLPKLNASDRVHYGEHFDAGSRDIVGQIYARDIDRFEYRFS